MLWSEIESDWMHTQWSKVPTAAQRRRNRCCCRWLLLPKGGRRRRRWWWQRHAWSRLAAAAASKCLRQVICVCCCYFWPQRYLKVSKQEASFLEPHNIYYSLGILISRLGWYRKKKVILGSFSCKGCHSRCEYCSNITITGRILKNIFLNIFLLHCNFSVSNWQVTYIVHTMPNEWEKGNIFSLSQKNISFSAIFLVLSRNYF